MQTVEFFDIRTLKVSRMAKTGESKRHDVK